MVWRWVIMVFCAGLVLAPAPLSRALAGSVSDNGDSNQETHQSQDSLSPSEAARIVQRAYSGAKILNVGPSNGHMVVTIKIGNEVKRVFVDIRSGEID